MKGTEKIIAHIQADAKAQADEIIASAKSKADEITAKYSAQAKDIFDKSVATSKSESDAKIESMERMSAMEAKKKTLALKQEMVGLSFDKATEMITKLPEAEYVAFLVKLAKEASVTGDEKVVLNARDKEAVGEKLISEANASGLKLTLADTTGDFAGGLILNRGNVEVNCTIELLMESKRSELSADVVKILFG